MRAVWGQGQTIVLHTDDAPDNLFALLFPRQSVSGHEQPTDLHRGEMRQQHTDGVPAWVLSR